MKKRHPFWTTLGVIFLVLIIAGGVTALCGYFLGWYDKTTDTEESDLEAGSRGDSDESGSVIIPYKIPEEDYEEYGITTYGDDVISAYTLTADLAGTYYDPRIDWKIEWDTSYTGNDDVQDYVSLTYETNVSWSATIVCLKPFGYNIYVTAYRTVYPDIYASCKLDYVAEAEATVSASFNETTQSVDVDIDSNIGVGTITGEFSFADDLKIVADEETISCIAGLLSDNFPGYFYRRYQRGINQGVIWSGTDTIYEIPFELVNYLVPFTFVYGDSNLNPIDFKPFIEALAYDICYWNQILSDKITEGSHGDGYYLSLGDGDAEPSDLYYVLSQAEWDFALTGTVLYTSVLGVEEIPFETRVTVTGGSFEITGDNATISIDNSNIIF